MELNDDKNLLQIIFDSSSNGIALMQCEYDKIGRVEDFTILLFNNHTLNWISNTDYKGKRYSEVFPMVRETGILEKFIEVAETGIPANFERYYPGEGMHHWFRFTAVRQDELLVVTTEDITEWKKTEGSLHEALEYAERQRRLYASIANNTPDLVYVFDLDYKFSYANRALLSMWGKSAEEAIGYGLRENGYEEWHAQLHEREIDEIIRDKKPVRGVVSFPHSELGNRIYDYILVPVLDEEGNVEAIAGTTRDITDIKSAEDRLLLSETRLRNMIDQTPAPTLVLMGDDLTITQINRSMLEMIGFGEEAIGMPLLALMPELAEQYIWKQVLKVYTDGVPFDQSEVLVAHKRTGVMRDYHYNIAYRPLKEEGKIIGMIQVAIDVTEQINARKELEKSERQYRALSQTLEQQVYERTSELERSNDDLQQFAHVASHDLKEPVRKIKTFISRLEENLDNKLDEESLRFMDRIHVAADRMNSMIEGVLAYSTANATRQENGTVDLSDVVRNIEMDLEIALERTQGTIHYGNLPIVEGASVLLYQLFYNLINNSLKFARTGIPPVVILSSQKGTDDFVHIKISDNGIGFDDEYAENIFETFARLNPKDRYEGTGLGLSLCKKIVERHGGTIVANGSLNHGAEFIITLPLRQKQEII